MTKPKPHTDGQTNRQKNVVDIEDLLIELLPMQFDKLVGIIAYKMGLSPDTVKYSYLSMFRNVGFIWMDRHGVVFLTAKTPKPKEDSEEELTPQESAEEINRLRNKSEKAT